MKKALLFGLSLSLALSLTACGVSNENTVDSTQETNTPAVTEPADTSTPESEKETNFEEPPVPVIYDIANDPDKDGAISKEEWEDWVAKHPEDKNQNMDLTDDVVIETPTPTPDPGTSSGNNNSGGTTSGGGGTTNSGGTTSGGGTSSGNNNSGGTTSGGGTTTTPSTPDANTGNDVTPGNTNISDEEMDAIKGMIEDSGGTFHGDITDEDMEDLADDMGGTYDSDTGIIVPDENSGWVM